VNSGRRGPGTSHGPTVSTRRIFADVVHTARRWNSGFRTRSFSSASRESPQSYTARGWSPPRPLLSCAGLQNGSRTCVSAGPCCSVGQKGYYRFLPCLVGRKLCAGVLGTATGGLTPRLLARPVTTECKGTSAGIRDGIRRRANTTSEAAADGRGILISAEGSRRCARHSSTLCPWRCATSRSVSSSPVNVRYRVCIRWSCGSVRCAISSSRPICDRSKSRCPERMARPPSSGTSELVFASSRPRRRPGRPWPGGRPCGSVAFAQPRRGRG